MPDTNQSTNSPETATNRFLIVFIHFGFLIALLFFNLDNLLGAIALRSWYPRIGVGVAVTSLFLIPLVLFYHRFSREARHGCLGVMAVFLLLAMVFWPFLVVVGWFTSFITGAGWISISMITILAAILLGMQLILSKIDTGTSKNIAKWLTVPVLIYSAGYFLGIAAIPHNAEAVIYDHETYDNKQYFLYLWYGWLGDPDSLTLYECNVIGIYCQVSYEGPSDYYRDRQLSIEVDPQTQVIGVQVDHLFSPRELTESDVAYLCAFFHIDVEDPFCASPLFQEYSSFGRMIERNIGIQYRNVLPFFRQIPAFNEATCPPPNTVLSNEQPTFICQLQFPENDLILELHMTKLSSGNDVWYRINLVNPDCNCHRD